MFTKIQPLPSVRFEPTMDPNTVYRHLQLSDGGRKATMRAENLNPPDHPERFHFWRQVLCREPLGGSPYYWEVEWSGQKVSVEMKFLTWTYFESSMQLLHIKFSFSS